MPSELEELIEFLHHGNTQIRQISAEHLVGYSTKSPSVFKRDQLSPIRDLKLLVRDYPDIAKNALTILINLSADQDILKNLAQDDVLVEDLLRCILNAKESNADLMVMLLANLAKDDSLRRIIKLSRRDVKPLSDSDLALDQLMDVFVKGSDGSFNKNANYDYLAYFFGDIAKFPESQVYFTTPQPYDSIIPLTKLTVFTENLSHIRRQGVASTIKNTAFLTSAHAGLVSSTAVNILPYLLLPLCGPTDFETSPNAPTLLPDLELLLPDKKREHDSEIVKKHLESLLLLTTTRAGRDAMRAAGTYAVVQVLHLEVDDDGVREACERLVDMLIRDEEPDEVPEEDEDESNMVEIF